MVKKKVEKKVESKVENKKEEKKVPLGVKIISIVIYVNAVLLALAALAYFYYGITGTDLSSTVVIGSTALYVVAVVYMAIAVFAFFVGRGLWKGKNWARIVIIVLSIIGIVQAIATFTYSGLTTFDIVWGLANLALNALIGGYLIFNKNVKKAFS